MRRAALIAALLLVAPGCFVFDELDAGREIMEKHSPKNKVEKKEEESPKAAASARGGDDEGLVAQLRGWLVDRTAKTTPDRPQYDPDDVPVRCRIGAGTHFVRKSDCQIRGGRVL